MYSCIKTISVTACGGTYRTREKISFICLGLPYQSKSMGMIWKNLGHIWPISGNGMGRLSTDMEFIWCQMLPNFKVWEEQAIESLSDYVTLPWL